MIWKISFSFQTIPLSQQAPKSDVISIKSGLTVQSVSSNNGNSTCAVNSLTPQQQASATEGCVNSNYIRPIIV